MSITAMNQALEVLETLDCGDTYKTHNAATSLRQAIAEAEKQEPVAWMRTSGTGSPVVTEALLVEMPEMRWNFQQPLYTHPPQRSEDAKQPKESATQEPIGYLEIDDIESQREYPHNCRSVNLWYEGGEGLAAIYTHPQPKAEQEHDEVTKLKGEIGVLVGLLGAAQQVIETVDAENAEESEALIHLHMKIIYAIQGASSL